MRALFTGEGSHHMHLRQWSERLALGAAAALALMVPGPSRAQTTSAGGGTQTSVKTAKPSTTAVSDPQAPFANPNGLVAAPNVDLSQEMVGQMIASYSFAANATVMKADDRTTGTLLDLTA